MVNPTRATLSKNLTRLDMPLPEFQPLHAAVGALAADPLLEGTREAPRSSLRLSLQYRSIASAACATGSPSPSTKRVASSRQRLCRVRSASSAPSSAATRVAVY